MDYKNHQPRHERMKKIHTTASSSNLFGKLISDKHEKKVKDSMSKALKRKIK